MMKRLTRLLVVAFGVGFLLNSTPSVASASCSSPGTPHQCEIATPIDCPIQWDGFDYPTEGACLDDLSESCYNHLCEQCLGADLYDIVYDDQQDLCNARCSCLI